MMLEQSASWAVEGETNELCWRTRMVALLIAAALLCLAMPAALLAALFYNDYEARRAQQGIDAMAEAAVRHRI